MSSGSTKPHTDTIKQNNTRQSFGLICPPFEYIDLEGLSNPNYQKRSDSISNIYSQIDNSKSYVRYK